MGLIFRDNFPVGHKFHGKTLSLDGFAKAYGLRFKPWEIVNGSSRRVEEQIALRCASGNLPVVIFDWSNEELVAEYFEHHPDEMPKGTAAVAKMIAATTAPEVVGKPSAPPLEMESIPPMTISHVVPKGRKAVAAAPVVTEE